MAQATPQTSEYKYNLAGIFIEQTYPSGRVTKNILEADGDLASISSRVANGQFKTYASNFAYTASGVIEHLQIGSGLWESAKLNSRDQVTELNMGNSPTDGSLWKLKYDYGELDRTAMWMQRKMRATSSNRPSVSRAYRNRSCRLTNTILWIESRKPKR